MDNRSLRAQVRSRLQQYQVDLRTTGVPAQVGDYATPKPNVFVAGRPGYIWVRNSESLPIQVLCKRVNPGYNMSVMIGYDPLEPAILQVLSIVSGTADGYYAPPGSLGGGVAIHAPTHIFTGSDPVFIYNRQMLNGRISSGTLDGSSAAVNIWGDAVFISGSWVVISQRTIDLTSYIPAATGGVDNSRYVGLTVSKLDVVTVTSGSVVVGQSPTLADVPNVPEDEYLLGFVRLYSSMTYVGDSQEYTDILDTRTMLIPGGGVAPASVSYLTSGSTAALPNHRQLAAGNGVVIVDGGAGGLLTINATGGGSSGGNASAGEYLRRDASNEPITGRLDVNSSGSSAFRVQSAIYTPGSVLSSGSIPVTSDDGATITGLTIGQWYAVESFGGPWAPWVGITPRFYTFSASNISSGSSGWEGIMGFQDGMPIDPYRGVTYPATYQSYPSWASYYEAVGNYGRFYFQATTTSIRVRVADYGGCGDNTGTLSWMLYSVTANVYPVLNVDTVSNMVTVSGDLTVTALKTANYFLAGPSSGAAAPATFRALVAADIAGLSSAGVSTDAIWTAKGDLAVGIGSGSAAILGVGTAGQVLTVSGSGAFDLGWAAPASSGHAIQDEGTPLAARANLNFVGAGVAATDDVANDATIVTVPHYEILQDSDGAILTDSTGAIIYVGVV
jgi:hypothetical protein